MDSGCVDFADLLVRCMSTCPRRKLLIKKGFSRPNSSRPPLYHQTRPHPVPPRTAVNEPFRVVVVVVVCSAAPDMPTWHACRTSTHPTGERMTTTTTGEKAEREGARVHNRRTPSFDPIPFIPSLLLRKASQEESKVVWTTTSPSSPTKPNQTQPVTATQTAGIGSPQRQGYGGKGCRDVVGTGGRAVHFFLAAAVAWGAFTARPNGEPTAALVGGVPRQFCWVWNWPR